MEYYHTSNYCSISQKGHRFTLPWIWLDWSNLDRNVKDKSEFFRESVPSLHVYLRILKQHLFILFFRSLGKSSPSRNVVNKYRVHEGSILIKGIRSLERKSEQIFYITIAYVFVWLIFDLLLWFGTKSCWWKTAKFLKKIIKMHFCIQLNQKSSQILFFFLSCRYFQSDLFFFFKVGNTLNISVKSAWAHA